METKDEKLVNVRPIVLSALCLAGGIFFAYLSFLYGYWIIITFLVAFCILLLLSSFIKTKNVKRAQLFICIALIFFTLGQTLAFVRIDKAQDLTYHERYGQVSGTVYEISYTDYGAFVYLRNCTFAGNEVDSKAVGFVFNNNLVAKMDIGAVMNFDCKIVNRVMDEGLSYNTLAGVYYSLEEITNITITDFDANFFELGYLKTRQFLKENLSEKGFAMALALLLGETSYYGKEDLQNYRFAGIAHVFAVSGLHLGVIVALFTWLAKAFKLKRKVRPLFILIPAFIYCGICGFRPSSLRAFLMASVTILSEYTGFKKDNLSSISLSAIVLLILNPFNLLDYGFRLSYVAVISIFALSPLFERHAKPLKSLSGAVSVSLSAQIGTLPVLCEMSGYISIISLFVNVIFVPVAIFLYLVTFASFIVSSISSLIFARAGLLMWLSDYLICAVDFIIGKIEFSTFTIPMGFGILELIWYLGFACVGEYVNLSGRRKFLIGILTVLSTFLTAVLVAL